MSYWLKNEFTYNPGFNYFGGGGSAGKIDFPTHMKDIHKEWFEYSGSAPVMTTSLYDVMDTGLVNNPLEAMDFADPDRVGGPIEGMDNQLAQLDTEVDSLDPNTQWSGIVDDAVAKLDSAGVLEEVDLATVISNAKTSAENDLQRSIEKALEMIDSQIIVKAVESFARAREKQRARMKTRYKAGMANINAERSSAYGLGLALLEMDFERELGQYESEFSNQLYQQGIQFMAEMISNEIQLRLSVAQQEVQNRNQMVTGHVQLMIQYRQFMTEMEKALTQITAEIERIGYVMKTEQTTKMMDLNWKHAIWDFKVYEKGIAVLGGLGGGKAMPEEPSTAASALGGAMSGAGLGASIGGAVAGGAGTGAAAGSAGGPPGALIGAGIGAVVGGLAAVL